MARLRVRLLGGVDVGRGVGDAMGADVAVTVAALLPCATGSRLVVGRKKAATWNMSRLDSPSAASRSTSSGTSTHSRRRRLRRAGLLRDARVCPQLHPPILPLVPVASRRRCAFALDGP